MKLLNLSVGAAILLTSVAPALSDDIVKVLSIVTNRPGETDYIAGIEKSFEDANPGVDVQVEYMDDESFKVKLPTLLQSNQKPDLFFSFSGGLVAEQQSQGVLRDITDHINSTGCAAQHSAGGMASYSVDERVYGLPMYASNVALYYNMDLAEKAGIDPQQIKTWDDFLGQVQAAKDAGVTPIVLGAKDRWPAMFYHAMLALRMVGLEGYAAAMAGENGGFASPEWVAVSEQLARLGELEPFQSGYLDTTYDKSQTLFGDGVGMFMLMGEWLVPAQAATATDGKGIPKDRIGAVPFPVVEGGKGDADGTFGGMNGWLISAGASDTAVDFLCHYVGTDNQRTAAEAGFWLPVAKGTADAVSDPHNSWAAAQLGKSSSHTVFDQNLPGAVAGAQLDAAVDLISGATTPEDAQQLIEDERQLL
ncbi:ABC transporter substrate-binding protein [Oricola sp.]|uniref:ABC transporter substrate-binding protein n=1 Tax=Oricola sp. TaxID=1979950 RepID=UPI003BA9E1FD